LCGVIPRVSAATHDRASSGHSAGDATVIAAEIVDAADSSAAGVTAAGIADAADSSGVAAVVEAIIADTTAATRRNDGHS